MTDIETRSAYRILDASANRASEGLRCLEEHARFVLNDPESTEALKGLRHELAAAMQRFPRQMLLAARDTTGDVGTSITRPSENDRSCLADVVAAAVARTGQSLRVLEEYGKLFDATFAGTVEQLRYRSYTLFARLERGALSNPRPHDQRRWCLARAQLYVLIDCGKTEPDYAAMVKSLFESGVHILQLRDRNADDRTLIDRARLGTQIARERDGLFIVNDRADLAFAADADGVHVGQDELPAPVARQIIGTNRLVGVSTHSLEQAQQAIRQGADYIGCGPVFPGRTKAFEKYVGTELLQQVSRQIDVPAFAIGGIDLENISEVVRSGFPRVAVTGVIRDSDDPAATASKLRASLGPLGDQTIAGRKTSADSKTSAGRQQSTAR